MPCLKVEQYAQAASEYEHTAYGYPKNAKSAAAAYAALVVLPEGRREALSRRGKAAWHARAIDAEHQVRAEPFREHPESSGVLTRAAEDIFAAHDLPRSIQVSQLLLARTPPVEPAQQRIAWNIIGQSQYDLGVYDSGRRRLHPGARSFAGPDPANVKLRADLTERIAASVYRQGEARRRPAMPAVRWTDFLRVAQGGAGFQDRRHRPVRCGGRLINLKQWDQAIAVLEPYRKQNPRANCRGCDTQARGRLLRRPTGRRMPPRSSSTSRPTPPRSRAVRREACRAADLYGRRATRAKTVAMLDARSIPNIRRRLPMPSKCASSWRRSAASDGNSAASAMAARDRPGRCAGGRRAHRSDRYLAAKAQLKLAQPLRDAFRAIRLVAPLKKSLVAKRKSMEAALAAYKAAADYHVAEVTTAATYETAELYRRLGKDVMDSERPKKLEQG